MELLRVLRVRLGSGACNKVPTQPVKSNLLLPFQILLSVAKVVFPLLAEVYAVDNTVDGIVTEVRVHQLNQRMKFLCSKRTLPE